MFVRSRQVGIPEQRRPAPATDDPADTAAAAEPGTGAAGPHPLLFRLDRCVDRFGWLIAGLFTLAVVLWRITTPALWRDELSTWWGATIPFADFVRLIGHVDAVMAPYYVFMRGWVLLFGDSALALRLPSALAVAGAASVLALLGRRLFTPWIGLVAGGIFAIMPTTTRYGQEARGYAFAMLAAVVATYALVNALERPTWRRWAWYAGSVVLVGAGHMLSLAILVGHAVAVACWWWPERDRRIARWFAAVAVAMLPLAPMLWLGLKERDQINISELSFDMISYMVTRTFGAALVAGVVIGVGLGARWRDHRALVTIAAWAALAPGSLALLSLVKPVFLWRYLLFCVPAWALLAAVVVGAGASMVIWRGRFVIAQATAVLIAIAILAFPAIRTYHSRYERQGNDYAESLSLMLDRMQAGDAVAYGRSDWVYMTMLAVRYHVPDSGELDEVFTVETAGDAGWWIPTECPDAAACIGQTERIWVVVWTENHDDPLAEMDGTRDKETLLREDYAIVDQRWSGDFGTLLLVRTPES